MKTEMVDMCPNCGYYEKKKDTWKNTIFTFIIFIGITTLLLISLIIIIKGWNAPFSIVEYIFNNDLGLNLAIRERAINLTKDCDEGDQDCEAYNLYKYVNSFKYVATTSFIPFDELEKEKAGDCKNLARYLTSLANNININSYVDCNNKINHCISIIITDEKKYLADPASGIWKNIPNNYNYWKEYGG